MWRQLRGLLLVAIVALAMPALSQDLDVYADALANGFEDYSFGQPVNLTATAQVHGGTKSISWQPQNYSGLSFAHPNGTLSTANYSGLTFWLWCSADCGRQLNLSFQLMSAAGLLNDVSLAGAYPGGVLPAQQWTQITISLDAGSWALAANSNFDRFNLQDEVNTGPTNTLYIDDVKLIARGAGPPPGSPPLPPPTPAVAATPLSFTASSTVTGLAGSSFNWIDSTGNARSAHMASGNAGANKGGMLNQFVYKLPNNATRTVNRSPIGAGGFGYIVSHLEDASRANNHGEDDSPLGPPPGDNAAGNTQTVFAGRHHALHVYTLNYPRWGRNAAMVDTKYNMPVTVGWLFGTGRNHPLWTVSFDMTQMPANAVSADTRAPYGDMNFDGTTGEGTPGSDAVGGIGWGDYYKFRTTASPVTLNSGWTWNVANTIPHNMLWGSSTDSEMGIVQTQPIAQKDAGGYFGINQWGSTSAAGNACPGAGTRMPCDFAWPYQSLNYSFGGNNVATDSKRLAWGANFGYLGQSSYPQRDYAATRSGHPRQSYSTYIVMDAHSRTPTDIQVAQMEARQLSSVSASVGTVAANGPAGIGRVDTVTYQPAGFDPVFDAWTFTASGNSVAATLTTPAPYKTHNPLIVVRGYTLATEPAEVRVGGVLMTPDLDYYASAIASRNELWLTLRGQFQGSTAIVINGTVAAVNYTVTPSAGANGSISPSTPQTVASGATTTFTVTPAMGYAASMSGTCGGTLNTMTGVFTTAAIVANCTVIASFNPAPFGLDKVFSRKTHAAAGTFDLQLDTGVPITGAVTVEPRAIGAGHVIVFRFNNTVTVPGNVTVVDANAMAIGSASVPVISGAGNRDVIVTITGIPDARRITVSLSGVNGATGAVVSMGFLVGDVSSSRSVNASDISAIKARAGPVTGLVNFRFDLNASGDIGAADLSLAKLRSGLTLP